ncbi:hypothetical protein M3Y99_00790200 [Aphelenchoides fujianensis]|nr:hypothetical protein M3Y99_00790200 [Aphelenchoides fujianensis]
MSALQRCFFPQIVPDRIEQAKLEGSCRYSTVSFSQMQTVFLVEDRRLRLHKQIANSRLDGWRRHGALKTIHQLGGWTMPSGSKKKHGDYKRVAPGSRVTEKPPDLPPILTFRDYLRRPVHSTSQTRTGPTDDTEVDDTEKPPSWEAPSNRPQKKKSRRRPSSGGR